MSTIQGQLNTPRDTTIQATNTALGLLGKDASLQDIKAALLQIVAALDPTADDYDQLSNKPQVNGVTLSGNKTSKQLGIRQTIPMRKEDYALLSSAEKMDVDKDYIITNANGTVAPIDDDSVSRNGVWSSYKVDDEISTLNSALEVKSKVFTGQQIGANAAVGYADADIKNAMIVGYLFYGATSTKIVIQSMYSDATGLHVVVKNMDSVTAPACNLTVYYIG